MKKRVRRSQDEWRHLVDEFSNSGLTQSAFCKGQKIPLVSFNNWKRRFENENSDDTDWVSLQPSTSSVAGFDVELELGNGMVLRLRLA